MKQKMVKLLPVAAAMALMGASAAHAEGFSYGGYFRAGAGLGAQKGQNRTCYQAVGSDWKYRLGNECDYYGEFMLAYGAGKKDETQYNIYWMPNFYSGGVSDASSLGGNATPVHTEQLYGEVVHPDFAPNTTWWAGSRFYGRQNGNMNDTFYVNMSGTGGGVDIDVGGPVVGLALFRNDDTATKPGTRFNVDVNNLPAGFRLTLAVTKGDFNGGQNGTAVSLQNHQSVFGGDNFAWVQFAQGSAGLNEGFGGLTSGSDVKGFRLADNLTAQFNPTLGGEFTLAYQENKCSTTGNCANANAAVAAAYNGALKHTSVAGRLAVGFPGVKNFKVDGELAWDSVKWPGGNIGTASMTKFTIAPTITGGPGYNDRPEIRFYVTTAHWNSGNNAAATLIQGTNGYSDLGGKTNGTSYGVQIETWF